MLSYYNVVILSYYNVVTISYHQGVTLLSTHLSGSITQHLFLKPIPEGFQKMILGREKLENRTFGHPSFRQSQQNLWCASHLCGY